MVDPPHHLIIHIARDSAAMKDELDVDGSQIQIEYVWKDDSVIAFDPTMTLWGWVWVLAAVAQHTGTTADGGHWLAFVEEGRQWRCYDDDKPPRRVTEDEVTSLPVSMLVYRRETKAQACDQCGLWKGRGAGDDLCSCC